MTARPGALAPGRPSSRRTFRPSRRAVPPTTIMVLAQAAQARYRRMPRRSSSRCRSRSTSPVASKEHVAAALRRALGLARRFADGMGRRRRSACADRTPLSRPRSGRALLSARRRVLRGSWSGTIGPFHAAPAHRSSPAEVVLLAHRSARAMLQPVCGRA